MTHQLLTATAAALLDLHVHPQKEHLHLEKVGWGLLEEGLDWCEKSEG
jgi:hypothetical protein